MLQLLHVSFLHKLYSMFCANLSPELHSMSTADVHFHLLTGAYKGTGGTLSASHVGLHVPLQPLLGNGTVRTLLARVWFFSSVSPHVIPQVSGKVSCVVTISAFVTLEGGASPPCCHASPPVPGLLGTLHQDLLRMANLFICCTLVYLQKAQPVSTKHTVVGLHKYSLCYFLDTLNQCVRLACLLYLNAGRCRNLLAFSSNQLIYNTQHFCSLYRLLYTPYMADS